MNPVIILFALSAFFLAIAIRTRTMSEKKWLKRLESGSRTPVTLDYSKYSQKKVRSATAILFLFEAACLFLLGLTIAAGLDLEEHPALIRIFMGGLIAPPIVYWPLVLVFCKKSKYRKNKHLTLLLLFLSAPLLPAPAQEPSVPDGEKMSAYYLTADNGWGSVPRGWKRQQDLLKESTDSDLETMALHSDTPALRAMAFHALAEKHSPRCYDILLTELTDTATFEVAQFDVFFTLDVSSFDMWVAESDSLLFTAGQRHKIDSAVVFGQGLRHLDKFFSASRLRGMEGLPDRLHTLYLEGDSDLLPLIAEGKNKADIPLVISALREYKIGLDEDGANTMGNKGSTNDALNALMKWQDEAFMPVLEELRDYELSRKYIDYYRVMMLFKVVMAYDNDWAYHFIEDTFENKGAKNKFYYPENLYRAYYEENGPRRFVPLVLQYAKKPFDWDF